MLTGVILLIVLRGTAAGCDPYAAFLRGAKRGMHSAVGILPALCAMMLLLAVFNASGASEGMTRLAAPLMRLFHLPEEVAPILLLRPLSGSGSIAALEQIFKQSGVDSRAGMIASVLMGSSETVFYTMTVYLGAAGIQRLKWVIPVSLVSYAASAVLCGLII